MASELLVATRSRDKLDEIRAIILKSVPGRLITLDDAGITPSADEDVIEAFDTFTENALAKARYFHALTGLPTLADDSGIVVQALGGKPGVRTKRFAIDRGRVSVDTGGKSLDDANNQLLLELLAGLPDGERAAHYVCAAAYADASGRITSSLGTCSGSIAHARAGSGGFGYDPLFLLGDLGITFAELSQREKNMRSHRAIAFRAIAPRLA